MQRLEDTPTDNRIKRGRDEDRFYCPYPGCTRSFAELWRLKVHYRAPPDVRGSGKERGHGTELQFCPKCGKELKPGKHHVGCFAGRVGSRQAVKRAREEELASEVKRTDDASGTSSESARQRTRKSTLREIKSEEVLPRSGSLNRFSEEAASLTRSGWHGEYSLAEAAAKQHEQQQQQHDFADADFFDQKNPAELFGRYQQMLPSLRRPGRSLQGLPSASSPPPSPPGDLDPDLANMQPLFDFGLFSPDRARGRNARLPVAVTSTLHADVPLPPDNQILQALLGEANSFAASSASQLPSGDRQRIQNSLAQQRIEQVAASAQELLRNQGPPFPSHASNRFPSPPQNLPSSFDFSDRDSMALAGLLQPPNQFVSSMEHYEPPGSGRPGKMHGQRPSFRAPYQGWTHRPVPSRNAPDFASGPSPLPSPPALINTQQRELNSDRFQSALPWDVRWGGLPVEPSVAHSSFRFREQLQQQQQAHRQEQQQQQRRQQQQQQQQQEHVTQSPPLGADAIEAARHSSDFGFRHLTSPQQPRTFTFLPSQQSVEPQGGFRDQARSPFWSGGHITGSSAESFGFPGASVTDEEASNEAFLAYSRRLLSQDAPNQDLPAWGNQEVSLFDRMGGVSPVDGLNSFGDTAKLTNPTHGRYASAAELGQVDPLSGHEAGRFAGWSHVGGGGPSGQAAKQHDDNAQASSHSASLIYKDCVRQQQQPQQQHVPTTGQQQQ